MASTFSDLKFELIGTGDQSGTWGTTTNLNLGTAIEEAITGSATVTFADADEALTLTDTPTTQTARNLRLTLAGTATGPLNLTVPDIEKFYIINNTLSYAVTIKNSTGSTVAIPANLSGLVYSTGLGIVNPHNYLTGTLVSSSVAILGGAINNTTVGAVVPESGKFTTLESTGNTIIGTTGANTLTVNAAANFATAPTFSGGPLGVASGGSGVTTLTAGYMVANGTNPFATVTTIPSTDITGLGTMAAQNANNVNITGGTLSGVTVSGTNVGTNASGDRTIQPISSGTPTGGNSGDIVYQY